jgi:hypothetical protein
VREGHERRCEAYCLACEFRIEGQMATLLASEHTDVSGHPVKLVKATVMTYLRAEDAR